MFDVSRMIPDKNNAQVTKDVDAPFACIFDLDGVLVRTDNLHIESWKAIADKLQVQLPENYSQLTRGLARRDSLNVILDHHDINLSDNVVDSLCNRKNQLFLELVEEQAESLLAEGVVDLLDSLKEMSVPCAIASSSNNARAIAEKLGIAGYFRIIIEARDVVQTKPHPESFIRAARELQYEESKCIIIEDSDPAIKAAGAHGFITLGIGKKTYLKSAIQHYDTISEIDTGILLSAIQNG